MRGKERIEMKRFLPTIIFLVSIAVLCPSFVWAQGTKEKPMKKAMAVEPDGKALWDHLKKMDYTKKWKMWPGKAALYKGTEPHGVLLTTYVNGPALNAISGKKGMLPYGSIVVKENYSSEKKLMAYTVMYKVKGYNPSGGDWFWAKYMPDGKIEAEGKVEMCISCHGKKKDNDYLFTGALK
jgi:hypothetical protein